MSGYKFFIEALRYPCSGKEEQLEVNLEGIVDRRLKRNCDKFYSAIELLSLQEWEELYTRTFDLNPVSTPYIGYQIWGDSYKRGAFMAQLNREYAQIGIDREGELPDHLIPVLHYLETYPTPVAELLEVFEGAVGRMLRDLRKSEPANPYRYLLTAILIMYKNNLSHLQKVQETQPNDKLNPALIPVFSNPDSNPRGGK